ncbi:uroporphyrinogen-III synthase, partial [Thermus scotoductus]
PLLPQGPGKAALQLYGKPLPLLENALAERSYRVLPLMPYRHLPDPVGIRRLEEALLGGEVDALAFVAAIQVEFLFEEAKDPKALKEVLNTRVKPLAVGRVTADALREWGVSPFYVDETERLGSMLQGFRKALQKEVA